MKRYQLKRFAFVPFDAWDEKVSYTIDEVYSDDVYLTDETNYTALMKGLTNKEIEL